MMILNALAAIACGLMGFTFTNLALQHHPSHHRLAFTILSILFFWSTGTLAQLAVSAWLTFLP